IVTSPLQSMCWRVTGFREVPRSRNLTPPWRIEMSKFHAVVPHRALAVGIVALLAACEAPQIPSAPVLTMRGGPLTPSSNGGAFDFTPLTSSYTCTVAGGSATQPLLLPPGFA